MKATGPDARLGQAEALVRAGRPGEAVAVLEAMVAADPSPRALNALARAHFEATDFGASERCLLRSLEANPNQPGVHVQLGRVRSRLGRLDDALASFEAATSAEPDSAAAHFHRGQLLRRLGRLDEALAGYDHALALGDDGVSVHLARCMLLFERGEVARALASCEQVLALQPGLATAQFVKAELLLMAGDYTPAWKLFESRWNGPWRKEEAKLAGVPVWTGEQPVAGRRILVHPELGLGDFLMFARYLPILQARGARLLVVAPAPLVRLLRAPGNLPQVLGPGEAFPRPDLRCPIMSLPRAFHTTRDTVPAEVPFLHTDTATREAWRRRLGPRTGALRVGLAWQGKSRPEIDGLVHKNRSVPLAELAPFFRLPIEFHSLQKDLPAADAKRLEELAVREHRGHLTDFLETAALVEEMDLVISIDTSVAHLAGALGKPVWLMLPYASDFRWPMDSRRTPWYPTATLFRQARPGQWKDVAEAVTQALQEILHGRQAS